MWEAVEDTSAQAENMKLRSSLMMAISEHIRSSGLSQAQAARLFAVTQPRVSDLMRGKINLFSIDSLVAMLSAAGLQVVMTIQRPAMQPASPAGKAPTPRKGTKITRQRSAA